MNDLKKQKLVSIIMPTYNSEHYIESALKSVVNQTYNTWELIIIDDGSTDNTRAIVEKYRSEDNRIKYYYTGINLGVATARNRAIDIAKGDYIAFLDSYDIWFEHKLEKQISFMEDNEYNFTSTNYAKIDKEGNYLNRTVVAKKRSDYFDILKKCPGNSTVIYNVKKIGKIKIDNIKKRNDYVMWLKISKSEKYLYGIDEVLGCHRVHSDGISNKKIYLVFYHWKVYREIEQLSLFKSIKLIVYWIIVTILKIK